MKKILALTLMIALGVFYSMKEKSIIESPMARQTIKMTKLIPKVSAKKTSKQLDRTATKKVPEKNKVKKVLKYTEIKNEYFTQHSKNLNVSVSKINDSKISINGKLTKVAHVLVRANKKNGPTSSYEALVNPKTKQVYRTWNQTKFETNKDFKISAAGLEYNSN